MGTHVHKSPGAASYWAASCGQTCASSPLKKYCNRRHATTRKRHAVQRCTRAGHIGLAVQDAKRSSHILYRLDRSGETGRVLAALMLQELLYAWALAIVVILLNYCRTRHVAPSRIHAVKRYNGAARIELAVQDAKAPSHTPHRPDRSGGTGRALAWLFPFDLPCAAIAAMVAALAEIVGLEAVVLSA